ncbi:MAG: hypothetical protein VCA36_13150, partial [Opitutales bacterium]
MSVQIDPIILQKLEDFRLRRRNLIILRGLCSLVVSLLAVFTTIAVIDYAVAGTPYFLTDVFRTILSIAGWAVVIFAVWRTCARLLIHLPSRRQLARLVEQIAPELREDLLSAVELGSDKGSELDSEVFRKLLQQDVSKRVEGLDMTTALPLTRLRRWLEATGTLLALAFLLLFVPDFGEDLRQLMGRALLPGANIAPVTDVQVEILAPKREVTITPKSEPLQFLVALSSENEGENENYGKVELQTKMEGEEHRTIAMSSRKKAIFSLDYNVGREKFSYRVLVEGSPSTKWYDLDVASRPFVLSYTKTYRSPEYTKLPDVTVTEDRGDISGWEGTEVDLVLNLNQPVTEGSLELDLTGGGLSMVDLNPTEDGKGLKTTVILKKPGTFRAISVISKKTGWKSIPSQAYEISVQLDEAPAIQFVDPDETSLLLPPDDILPITAVAEDDLALDKIEYHLRV